MWSIGDTPLKSSLDRQEQRLPGRTNWHASTEKETHRRQRQFCKKWQETQPKVIDTLHRGFEDTLTFYGVQAAAALRGEHWPPQHLRTPSFLE